MSSSYSPLLNSPASLKSIRRFTFFHAVLGLVLIVLAVSANRAAALNDGLLRVSVLDIGQGDAIFIQAPNGNQVLIDGGPNGSILERLGQVMPFYDQDIDVVIVSHPHSDHIAGLVDVLGRYQVGMIVQAEETYDSPQFRAWERAVADEHAVEEEAIVGKQITLGPELTLTLLHPFGSVAGTSTKKPHDDVVVALLQYRDFKMILTGDMEARVEQALIAQGIDIDADVLKIGHHGSKTSSSQLFLDAVSPKTAVISVGAHNMYHLPSPIVTQRLEQNGIPYYRTDTNGTVTVVSDGQSFRITTN